MIRVSLHTTCHYAVTRSRQTRPISTNRARVIICGFLGGYVGGVCLRRQFTDRGTEDCGAPERHAYELYLAVENNDHTRTKTRHPQTNGICERFHKTMLNKFYRVAFRKKIYQTLEELQADLDAWIQEHNEQRPHQSRLCSGKPPMHTFIDSVPLTKEKKS